MAKKAIELNGVLAGELLQRMNDPLYDKIWSFFNNAVSQEELNLFENLLLEVIPQLKAEVLETWDLDEEGD